MMSSVLNNSTKMIDSQMDQNIRISDSWDSIEEVQPDELDLQMIRQIQQDPDCQDFVSNQEAKKLFQ